MPSLREAETSAKQVQLRKPMKPKSDAVEVKRA
jgi:hypothetical protein